MNPKDPYQEFGEWLQLQFNIELIVCQLFGKRWAFKWSSTPDIENAHRIELTESVGIIVSAKVPESEVQKIKDEGLDFLRSKKQD